MSRSWRKKLVSLAAVAAILVGTLDIALAFTFLKPYTGQVKIKFSNWEEEDPAGPGNGNGLIDQQGEKLRGIAKVSSIHANTPTNDLLWYDGKDGEELTIEFGDYTSANIIEAGGNFSVDFTGGWMKVYLDSSLNFDSTYPGSGYQDGTLFISLQGTGGILPADNSVTLRSTVDGITSPFSGKGAGILTVIGGSGASLFGGVGAQVLQNSDIFAPDPMGSGWPVASEDPLIATYGCSGSIGDFVWSDVNHNGLQDGGEPGISGVKVELYQGANLIAATLTNGNGLYQFVGLCAGQYTVKVDSTTVPAGMVATSPRSSNGDDLVPNDSNEPTGTSVTLAANNTSNQTVDFGYYTPCTGSIGDYAWNDLNHNGLQDGGEPGIAGVTLELYQGGSLMATTVTNAGGLYLFSGLCAGDYLVKAPTSPPGMTPTAPRSNNGNDLVPNDSNEPTGTSVLLPTDNTSNPTIDFGFYAQLQCNLKVNKTCGVAPQSTSSFACSDSKPFDKVYLKLGGGKNISSYNVYIGAKVDSAKLCDSGGSINAGDSFIVQCTNSSLKSSFTSSNDIIMTFEFEDGTWGKSTFHKSCSDADMNGPEDCGTPTGNGKKNETAHFNGWLFDGMHGLKGELLCSAPTVPAPFPTSESCTAEVGDTVVYGYTVSNFGDTAMVSSVMDDKLGQINAAPFTLITGEAKQFTKSTTINATTTNVVTVTSTLADGQVCEAVDSLTVDIPETQCPGTGTPGYWKNHPEAWPVDTITIGCATYSKSKAIWWMNQSDGDKTITLFRALVAAKLNILIGNDSSCIQSTIDAADTWLCKYKLGSGISGSSKAWKSGEPLYLALDKYNNGLMCCPARDYTGDSHFDCPPAK